MANAGASASSGVFHIRNTLRFIMKKEVEEELMERMLFNRMVLLGLLKMQVKDLLCVQRNGPQRYFDVTTVTEDAYKKLFSGTQNSSEVGFLKSFLFFPLWNENFRVFSVRMYNPFVEPHRIEGFFDRFCDIQPGSHQKRRDDLGIWTGLWQFRMFLRPDPEGVDGYRHPPASFSIGGNRGYCFYARQPKYCRRCLSFGHLAEGCSITRCHSCRQEGHLAKDCPKARSCTVCGSAEHTAEQCGDRAGPRSYAEAAAGGGAPYGGEPSRPAPGPEKTSRPQDEEVEVGPKKKAQQEGEEPEPQVPEEGASGESSAPVVSDEEAGSPTGYQSASEQMEGGEDSSLPPGQGGKGRPASEDSGSDGGGGAASGEEPFSHVKKRRKGKKALAAESVSPEPEPGPSGVPSGGVGKDTSAGVGGRSAPGGAEGKSSPEESPSSVSGTEGLGIMDWGSMSPPSPELVYPEAGESNSDSFVEEMGEGFGNA